MNPQQISTSFLIATGHIRAMRGGAQSHMLTGWVAHPLPISVFASIVDAVGAPFSRGVCARVG